MTDKSTKVNFEEKYWRMAEAKRLVEMDYENLSNEVAYLENSLKDAETEVAFLKGQVEAFKLCLKKAVAKNDKLRSDNRCRRC